MATPPVKRQTITSTSPHFDSGVDKVVLFKPYCRTCDWVGPARDDEREALQLLAWHWREDHRC